MKNKQGLTIAALIIAIVGLSIGFAAFSNTLNISSSASVNPDASSLKVVFAKDYFTDQKTTLNQLDTTAVVPTTAGTGVTATNGVINNDGQDGPTLTGLSAAFTAPGQSVTYNLYVVNAGQLKAYLTDIEFGTIGTPAKAVSCTVAQTKKVNDTTVNLTDEEKATESLVNAACEGISVSVKIGTLTPMTSSGSLNNLPLEVKGYEPVQIVISYTSGSAYVDGPMNVAFGDVSINASSVAAQSQAQPQVDSLIPTDQELAVASPEGNDQYRFAEFEGEEDGDAITIMYNGGAGVVMLSVSNLSYVYICDSTAANNMGMNAYRWYSSSDNLTFTEYTGSSPISLSDFASGTVFSESYVTRVINSFSNNG